MYEHEILGMQYAGLTFTLYSSTVQMHICDVSAMLALSSGEDYKE